MDDATEARCAKILADAFTTNEDCLVPLVFNADHGYRLGAKDWTACQFRNTTWHFNPWTGQPRSAEEIAADPKGLHVWPPTVTAAEAPAGEHAAAPAPICNCGGYAPHGASCNITLRTVKGGDAREARGRFSDRPTAEADAVTGAAHPSPRRNVYGLKDKYPSPPVSRLVGFCHPGVFKEWK